MQFQENVPPVSCTDGVTSPPVTVGCSRRPTGSSSLTGSATIIKSLDTGVVQPSSTTKRSYGVSHEPLQNFLDIDDLDASDSRNKAAGDVGGAAATESIASAATRGNAFKSETVPVRVPLRHCKDSSNEDTKKSDCNTQ